MPCVIAQEEDEGIMKFTIDHFNINVLDLDKSLAFYDSALGLREVKRMTADDGSYIIVYLGDGESANKLELTWLQSQEKPYDLGDEEFHIAFTTSDFNAAHALHKKMDCICYENEAMGIYFINDPDGYWLEILPAR
jgi:lactoylglutathione lyase